MTMSTLDGTIDSPNFDTLKKKWIKKERLNQLLPFNRINMSSSWNAIKQWFYLVYSLETFGNLLCKCILGDSAVALQIFVHFARFVSSSILFS